MEEAKEKGLRKTGEGQRGDRKDKEPVTGHLLGNLDRIVNNIRSISTREKCSWTQRHASANMEKLFSVSASPRSPG
ncbi:unnamed protein product [Spirodela intermedia]|uniref:Uncharacterized protein n=1 Tax=Spirodela intermedia TaxID=51605 RepID=A0A7I8I9T7_SPIIN|nr:unnamed protein product [Spirodela intermedia]CAA6653691.1 unnamed protein product [Spirodela intermedia]